MRKNFHFFVLHSDNLKFQEQLRHNTVSFACKGFSRIQPFHEDSIKFFKQFRIAENINCSFAKTYWQIKTNEAVQAIHLQTDGRGTRYIEEDNHHSDYIMNATTTVAVKHKLLETTKGAWGSSKEVMRFRDQSHLWQTGHLAWYQVVLSDDHFCS